MSTSDRTYGIKNVNSKLISVLYLQVIQTMKLDDQVELTLSLRSVLLLVIALYEIDKLPTQLMGVTQSKISALYYLIWNTLDILMSMLKDLF